MTKLSTPGLISSWDVNGFGFLLFHMCKRMDNPHPFTDGKDLITFSKMIVSLRLRVECAKLVLNCVIPSCCRSYLFHIVCVGSEMHWRHIDIYLAILDIICHPTGAAALELDGGHLLSREHGF